MIGTNIRGIRHLWRLSDTSLKYILVRGRDVSYDVCEVFKTPSDYKYGEKLYIFNGFLNHNTHNYQEVFKDFKEELKDIEHGRVLGITKNDKYDNLDDYRYIINDHFSEIILLPDTFKTDFSNFLKENSKILNNFKKKYDYNIENLPIAKMLYVFGNGSKNFFQWGLTLYFQQGIYPNIIKNILIWNENYKQLTKNLSKGTITAYTTRDGIIMLLDELENLRKEKRINDAINSFNTAQKKLFKSNELSDVDKQTLSRFAKLSETKRINFIRKVSTIEDFNELMRLMRHATNIHFEWNKESFMDFINNVEGINQEIILDQDNIVLTKVNDFDTVKQLGKATNWCITKNKSYWNNYIEQHKNKATQYMLFDFSKIEDDKLSIIGLTTIYNKGITSAHNFTNENLMGSRGECVLVESFMRKFDKHKNIYSIIKDCGIDINLIAQFDKPLYKWDKEGLMEYLFECVNSENVSIIKSELEDTNKLALSVRDENIRYFFGDSYINNIPSDYWGLQHMLFIDFSKSQYDPNKLEFAIIYDGNLNEDYCQAVYDERSQMIDHNDYFDVKIAEFGLPYDVIRRVDDKMTRYTKAFLNFNTKIIKEEINNDSKVIRKILDAIDQDALYDTLNYSMTHYSSFDYLDLIYNNGFKLSEFMEDGYCGDLLWSAFSMFKESCRRGNNHRILIEMNKPSDSVIKQFYDNAVDRETAMNVGTYLLFKTMFDNEVRDEINYISMYYKLITNIFSNGLKGSCIDDILSIASERIDFNVKNDCVKKFIQSCVIYGSEKLQEIASKVGDTNDYTRKIYKEATEYKSRIKKASEAVTVTINATNTAQ